jgi:hypothetical protein
VKAEQREKNIFFTGCWLIFGRNNSEILVMKSILLISILAGVSNASRKKSSQPKNSRHKERGNAFNCNFDSSLSGRERKSSKNSRIQRICLPYWKIKPYKCSKNGVDEQKGKKCHKFEWKIVNDKDYASKINPGMSNIFLLHILKRHIFSTLNLAAHYHL